MSDRKRHVDQIEHLFDRLVDELCAASDEEVLAGESPDIAKQRGLAVLNRARATAGRSRLASARGALSEVHKIGPARVVPIETARAYLLRAANDARYTLAARQLSEMSDDDVLAVYAQLVELEQEKPSIEGE